MPRFTWCRIFKRNNKVCPAECVEETVSTTEEEQIKKKLDPPKTSGRCRKFIRTLKNSFARLKKKMSRAGEEKTLANKTKRVEKEDKAQNEEAETSTPSFSQTSMQQLWSRGFTNFGNSCYVNASVQCLFSAEQFCTQLQCQVKQGIQHPSDKLIRSFAVLWLMRESSNCNIKDALMMMLINQAALTNPEFTPDDQNDAHQFMFHCLTQIEDAISRAGGTASDCPVKANFGFQITGIITCKGCGAEKRRTEDYNHLSLALLENGSVKDCLKFFFKDEKEIECRCGNCDCTSASCSWTLYTLPRYLVLQLKRFKLSSNFKLKKQLNSVKIDPKLQLRLPTQSERVQEGDKNMDEDVTPQEYRKAEERTDRHEVDQYASYSLISVLNHFGSSIHSGHYTCDSFSQTDHLWLSYDDDEVSLTTEEYILKKRQKSAYILIYEMK